MLNEGRAPLTDVGNCDISDLVKQADEHVVLPWQSWRLLPLADAFCLYVVLIGNVHMSFMILDIHIVIVSF